MHVVFIPYGKREKVEILLREMECQKFLMPCKKGDETMQAVIGGVIRVLPGGVHEYVFPREWLHHVLLTLTQAKLDRYDVGWFRLELLRRMFRLKKLPDLDHTKKEMMYPWEREHVNCIILGIREDKDLTEKPGTPFAGWIHEAL